MEKKRSIASEHNELSLPNNNEEQLLRLAHRGWRLFPVKARSKTPLVMGWPEAATSNSLQLAEWIRKYPKCNWGLATGSGSGSGILVLDADSDEALAELTRRGPLPRTFTVKTSRGQHFHFPVPQ